MSAAWESWERLRQQPEADPIEVLRAISAFQRYFDAIENEAIKVARSQDRTWQEIGAALGRSRQAIWQRASSRVGESKKADWEALSRLLEDSWATSAEVRHKIGMSPPKERASQAITFAVKVCARFSHHEDPVRSADRGRWPPCGPGVTWTR
jgi:hypothetical protein